MEGFVLDGCADGLSLVVDIWFIALLASLNIIVGVFMQSLLWAGRM